MASGIFARRSRRIQRDDHSLQQSREEDSQAFDIVSFLPPADYGSVLITTRLPSLGEVGQSMEVGRLTLDQALELLRRRSGLQPSGDGMIGLLV